MTTPKITAGKRLLVAGRTGSGKSALACWFLQRSQQTWVVLNPKHTGAYKNLPDSNVVKSLDPKKVSDSIKKYKYTIVNPPSSTADPDTMDAFIMWLHDSWTNIGLCCDELYAIHKGGHAGQGLLGWLTRGRELKQSFLGLTQRPAFLSQFLFSESDYIVSMSLSLKKDRKRMEEMTDRPAFNKVLDKYYWLYYDISNESLRYFEPIPVDDTSVSA